MCGELALTGFEQTESFESGQCLALAADPMDTGPLICNDKNIGASSGQFLVKIMLMRVLIME